MARKKVMVLAYAVSPFRGSEHSVAWNFVSYMAAWCDLTVLYGAAGPHMGDMAELEDHLAANPIPNVRFVPVKASWLANLMNWANRRGWLTYTFYLAYRLWHRRAHLVARELLKAQSFDLIHYLNPIGYREPGHLWKLDRPYVWGPIGGASNLPWRLLPALPPLGKARLTFRAVVNWLQLRLSPRVRGALARTDVLLTATTENQEIFRRVHGKQSWYLPENGIVGDIALDEGKFDAPPRIELIWIGSIEARKALRILVEALARCPRRAHFLVHVVGDGPLRPALQERVRELGLGEVFSWHGWIPRGQVQALLSRCHLHVVTSVSEGNPTTIWEAMSRGVPTITIDHCGMRDTVTERTGIKVPLDTYDRLVSTFSRRLGELAERPSMLRDLAASVMAEAPRYHWRLRPEFLLARYDDAILAWQERRRTSPST